MAAVCVAIASIVLRYTALGTYIQSVGINKKASRIAGFNSAKIILMCYAICGLCAGLAGMVATSRIYSADTNNIGLNMELDAILSVALGGNSLGGGKFSLAGSHHWSVHHPGDYHNSVCTWCFFCTGTGI